MVEWSKIGAKSLTIFDIRPHRGGWQCFEGPGVQPYFTGHGAKESAINYARMRSAMRAGAIRVWSADGVLEDQILFDERSRKL